MTDAEPKRSEDETQADAVRRRLVDTVRKHLEEIDRVSIAEADAGSPRHDES